MKKDYMAIEGIIENRIAELSEEYELESSDIAKIRLDAYHENGWYFDPFPEEEEEETGWKEEGNCCCMDMAQRLSEIGMSERDFF